MRTLGIDLAASHRRTGVVSIDWAEGTAQVLADHVEADHLVELIAAGDYDKVGIDCPFGWPVGFVEALKAHQSGAPWPTPQAAGSPGRDLLRFRGADRAVQKKLGLNPLSVSSSLLAITAMRCADLLSRLREAGLNVSRAGTGVVVEVYPAATLSSWGLLRQGYKKKGASELRREILDGVLAQVPELKVEPDVQQACATSDHALDALISAVTARLALQGATLSPSLEEQPAAEVEGWIHFPYPAKA